MNTRLCWMVIDPCDGPVYQKLLSGINSDQFTGDKSSGFLLDCLRPEHATGRFIERTSTIEKVRDPFGNETEVVRVGYVELGFRLQHDIPHLELYNPPRQLNAFVNRLGEFTRGASAIYCPELPLSDWIAVLTEVAETFTITNVILSDLELGERVTAKIAVQGPTDIREFVSRITGQRLYRFTQMTVSAVLPSGEIKVNLRTDSRGALRTSQIEFLSALRECFKLVFARQARGEGASVLPS